MLSDGTFASAFTALPAVRNIIPLARANGCGPLTKKHLRVNEWITSDYAMTTGWSNNNLTCRLWITQKRKKIAGIYNNYIEQTASFALNAAFPRAKRKLPADKPVSATGQRQPAGVRSLMRADNRDSLRATVLRWTTPLAAARCISGCASCNAAAAAAWSPPAIANSTFLIKLRIRDLRALLRAVRTIV
jgi:hypothetical protein